jgi:hypothetical protein
MKLTNLLSENMFHGSKNLSESQKRKLAFNDIMETIKQYGLHNEIHSKLEEQKTTTATAMDVSKKPIKQQIQDAYIVATKSIYGKPYNLPGLEIVEPGGAFGKFGGANLTINKDTNLKIKIVCSGPAEVTEPPRITSTNGDARQINAFFPDWQNGATEKRNPKGQSLGASVCRIIYEYYNPKQNS